MENMIELGELKCKCNVYMNQNDLTSSEIRLQTNHRIYDRNIPSSPLQPYLSVPPASTKYSIMPIVDPRRKLNVPLQVMPSFNPFTAFNPGNDEGPYSGYATNINIESELKNQIYALQSCDQAVYVPTSKSDLYNYGFTPGTNMTQPFPDLFNKPQFDQCNPLPAQIQQVVFYNPTRTQTIDASDSPIPKNK
jgi:hypothetical protein